MTTHTVTLYADRIRTVVFALDGVVADTAAVQASAWARVLDEFIDVHRRRTGSAVPAFDPEIDDIPFVNGRPPLARILDVLRNRGIVVRARRSVRRQGEETAASLAERARTACADVVKLEGVVVFPATVDFMRALHTRHLAVAVVSPEPLCSAVLTAAGIDQLVDALIEGRVGPGNGEGQLDPALFIEAGRALGAAPADTAVVDCTTAGIGAAAHAGFGLVIGIDRSGDRAGELYRAGAHVVVADLTDVSIVEARDHTALPRSTQPSAGRRASYALHREKR